MVHIVECGYNFKIIVKCNNAELPLIFHMKNLITESDEYGFIFHYQFEFWKILFLTGNHNSFMLYFCVVLQILDFNSIFFIMDGVVLLIITAVTAASTALCDGDLSKDSVVFSVASHGRLPGELLFDTLKDVLGDCLYACMQHTGCLTISYHRSSRTCKLMADVLFKEDIIDDFGWESYGHFESSLVSYIQNYVLF